MSDAPPTDGHGDLEARIVVRRPSGFVLDVDLEIPAGGTTALLGPNGAGKSTVALALAGLQPIDEGIVRVGEHILDDPATGILLPPHARRIGMVFQDYLLFPHMSVLENVAFGSEQQLGVSRSMARSIASEWLERLSLSNLSERRPSQLSGGQAQRVALARALASRPQVLVLDEPLAAVDVADRSRLRRLLAAHLGTFSGPRLLITHEPDEAFLLADRIVIIEGGRVTQSGSPEAIRLRPATRYAADLSGTNLFVGEATAGRVEIHGHPLAVADPSLSGRCVITIRSTAISLYLAKPDGSPRNTWPTSVEAVEPVGSLVRVMTGSPLPLAAEITPDARTALNLHRGSNVWVSIKATDIAVDADQTGTTASD